MGDNIFFSMGCPAKMSDSRLLTNWNQRDTVDAFYMQSLKAKDEHDYRKKLQKEGLELMKQTVAYYVSNATCNVPPPLNRPK